MLITVEKYSINRMISFESRRSCFIRTFLGDDMSRDNRTIMIVDDDKKMLKACIRLLSKDRYHCRIFTSPVKALDKLFEIKPAVVLSDQYMHRMFGTVFLARVKKIQPESVTIIMTGHRDTAPILTDLANGDIFTVIKKPWTARNFRSIIQGAFEHYQVLTASNVKN